MACALAGATATPAHADLVLPAVATALILANDVVTADGQVGQDQLPDLLTQDLVANTVTIKPQRPDGSFGPPAFVIPDHELASGNLFAGDLNSDGYLDFVSGGFGSGFLTVFLHKATGQVCPGDTAAGPYCTPVFYSLAGDIDSAHAAVYDVNSDDVLDIISTNLVGANITILLGIPDPLTGKGTGTFQAGYHIPSGGLGPSCVLLGDFHGATDPGPNVDVAITNLLSSSVALLYGDGQGGFTLHQVVSLLPQSVAPVCQNINGGVNGNDLNNDGYLDVVLGNSAGLLNLGNVEVLLGGADGRLHRGQRLSFGVATPYYTGLGDFDRDGFLDLVVGDAIGTLKTFRGVGNGTFQTTPSGTYSIVGGEWWIYVTYLSAAHRAQGIVDLVVAATGGLGDVWVLRGNGDGTFQPPARY